LNRTGIKADEIRGEIEDGRRYWCVRDFEIGSETGDEKLRKVWFITRGTMDIKMAGKSE
jgi:hypothetical protein